MTMKLLKHLLIAFIMILVLPSCQKEGPVLSMEDAINRVEKIIEKYPDRDWFASKSTIEPGSVLRFFPWGFMPDDIEMTQKYISPDYRAWLIVLAEDVSGLHPDLDCLHLFVDADSGKVEQVWLHGRVIVEWGSDPYSRYLEYGDIFSEDDE